MSQTARVEGAASVFKALRSAPRELEHACLRELDYWDSLLAYAAAALCAEEFQNLVLHAQFFGTESSIALGDESEAAFNGVRRALYRAAFDRRARSISDLAAKARIWRRVVSEDDSKTPDGFPDEFLAWSMCKDIRALARAQKSGEPPTLQKLSA